MKRILSLLLLIASITGLVSCRKKNDDIPEGMQLVRGGSDIGYYMYVPEEWTVSNQGNISAAYVSKIDSTSATYTETEHPETSLPEYFAKSTESYTPDMKFTLLSSENGVEYTFGNAEKALMFEFDFEYANHKFRSMQILAEFEGRFGIFTFTSFAENLSSADDNQYDYYKEKRDKIISEFKYVTKSGDTSVPNYEVNDGYKLISDEKTAKFKLYVPESFEVQYSSGIVSASFPDGSSVNMSKATQTNVRVDDYLNRRIEELKAIVSDVNIVKHKNEDGSESNFNANVSLGNAKSAAAQEYTYVYNGVTYHVYQVCAITQWNGFVFTYTAAEDNYYKNLDTVKEIAKRIEF